MFDQYVSLTLLAATCLMLFVSYQSFRKRKLPMARYNSIVMLAAAVYSLGYAFELMSAQLDTIRFWLRIEYLGIPFISTFWLILVIHYTGYQAVLTRRFLCFLFAIPVTTLLLFYTNDLHHLFYADVRLDTSAESSQASVVLDKGPWYWVHITYNYLQAVIGMLLFVIMYVKSVPIVRIQIAILMLGAAAPWLSNVIYLFGLTDNKLDMTPLGFTVSGGFYLWGIYRFHLLRLVPIGLQTVFETMEDGVIILDAENNVIHVNKAARAIFGERHPYQGSVDPMFAAYPEMKAMLGESEPCGGRVSMRQGEMSRTYDMKILPLRDKGQDVLGNMLVLHDVTEVIRYQEKLKASAKQLAEFSSFKDKLFTVVTHDIRDPLTMLLSAAELLEEEVGERGGRDTALFQEVLEQVRNSYLMVEHLLDWFRSQRGSMVYEPQPWNLASSVARVIHNVRTRSEQKQLTLISEVSRELMVLADKEMLDLVLRNLLSNAVKFTGQGGSIRVGASVSEAWVTVSVQDSGAGVDEEIGKSLFHDVQQAGSLGTDGETGSGLGLYLCEKFVSIHGGKIWYQSVRGQGSTFFFTMPLCQEHHEAEQTEVGRQAI